MGQRIRGQEVELLLLVDGAAQENLRLARSLEMSWKTEIQQEGYLGETSDQYDTIFKGIGGNIEFHLNSPQVFTIIEAIVDKARRRTPGTRFNIKATLNFPEGKRARIVIKDAEFGELPIGFGSRSDYGTFKLEFAASEARVLPIA